MLNSNAVTRFLKIIQSSPAGKSMFYLGYPGISNLHEIWRHPIVEIMNVVITLQVSQLSDFLLF